MIPAGKHNDWFWPFSLIPRSWNAWNSTTLPKQWLGNVPAGQHLDIPPKGTWTFASPGYFAFQTKGGLYFRIGIRYDYVDQYYTWPAFTIKRYK